MLNLKKRFTTDLMQVALILSLLRIDRRSLEYDIPAIGIGTHNLTNSWDQSSILIPREGRVHPKSIDSLLLNYEQEVFEELNSLGRYSNIFEFLTPRNLIAYLLSVEESQNVLTNPEEAAFSETSASAESTEDVSVLHKKGIDSEQLSQEDLDLIEILWKYDINVNNDEFLEDVSKISSTRGNVASPDEPHAPGGSLSITPESTNPFENLIPINSSEIFNYENENYDDEEEFRKQLFADDLSSDPWLGASSSVFVNVEHGVDILEVPHMKLEINNNNNNDNNDYEDDDDGFISSVFDFEFSLHENLRLSGLDGLHQNPVDFQFSPTSEVDSLKMKTEEVEDTREDLGIEADFLDDNLLDDLSSMLRSPEYPAHLADFVNNECRSSVYSTNVDQVHRSQLPFPFSDENFLNVFETVITTEDTSQLQSESSQNDSPHNSHLEVKFCLENYSCDASEEYKYDMANEVQPIQFTNNEFSLDQGTDSDSALSSMGSERVPSLYSNAEWMEMNSDSDLFVVDHFRSKNDWHEFMCNTHILSSDSVLSLSSFEEHHANNHVVHNHTYHLPSESVTSAEGKSHKSAVHDKMKNKSARKEAEQHLTRDERRARNLSIPISVNDIINLPIDDFNDRLSHHELSDFQISIIKDIRRRGKNKVAAQNCRKRKLDQIVTLEDEVKQVRDYKSDLFESQDFLLLEKQRIEDKYMQLCRHVFSNLPNHEQENFRMHEMARSSNDNVISTNNKPSERKTRNQNKDKSL